MPAARKAMANQAYRTTNHDLIGAIESVLAEAAGHECRKLRIIKVFKMAIFDCTLIDVISRTDPDILGRTISLDWLAEELSQLRDLKEAIRQGRTLTTDQATFLAAFSGLLELGSYNSAGHEEWLQNVIIEAECVLGFLPLVRGSTRE
ncbi:uncharacterized protein FMAN_08549 [Fusarium mangiferae]|uniref:Uncharacterized protein n=1 Tax=Fusarium mangiferae TaxID=192010 RepID=A0A1L7TR05_FUSMA|nr:uncharacterized protein FMAN_08549 [Fusarium mangiferae]CVK98613.1 uncharacterized protein FMAN_08549 [Fusarium mangiferae]